MKTKFTKQWMKVAGFGLALSGFAFVANAQETTVDGSVLKKMTAAIPGSTTTAAAATPAADDKTASADNLKAALGSQAGAVRVVDNKGTIKYLQVANGLTQVTNTDPTNGGIVTTWQLGGQFISDTKLDFNGHVFAFDNITRVDGTNATSGVPALTTKAIADPTTTGYTLLVRDEATGAIKKLLASDLVRGGQTTAKLDATTAAADFTYTDATFPADVNKVSVYRNGAKLLAGTDYTVATTAGASTITVLKASGAEPEDYTFVVGDRIEVQWVK
jgi:hypothetical protein